MGDDDQRRRYTRSLEGLLKFCTEHTITEDAPSNEPPTLSTERRAFLDQVLADLQGEDATSQLIQAVAELLADHLPLQRHIDAMELLQIHCEDMDLANDFHKLGGYKVIERLLLSAEGELRWRAADLVATLVQNNPYSQNAVLQEGFLSKLLHGLENDSNMTARVKALYAVSCLVRESKDALSQFTAQDGFSNLVRAMQTDDQRLQTKAAFLLANLFIQEPQCKEELYSMGLVEQLVVLLHSEHAVHHEHMMNALLNLVRGHEGAVAECRREELGLEVLLQQRAILLQDREEYEEEMSYCEELQTLCFNGGHSSANAVDR